MTTSKKTEKSDTPAKSPSKTKTVIKTPKPPKEKKEKKEKEPKPKREKKPAPISRRKHTKPATPLNMVIRERTSKPISYQEQLSAAMKNIFGSARKKRKNQEDKPKKPGKPRKSKTDKMDEEKDQKDSEEKEAPKKKTPKKTPEKNGAKEKEDSKKPTPKKDAKETPKASVTPKKVPNKSAPKDPHFDAIAKKLDDLGFGKLKWPITIDPVDYNIDDNEKLLEPAIAWLSSVFEQVDQEDTPGFKSGRFGLTGVRLARFNIKERSDYPQLNDNMVLMGDSDDAIVAFENDPKKSISEPIQSDRHPVSFDVPVCIIYDSTDEKPVEKTTVHEFLLSLKK